MTFAHSAAGRDAGDTRAELCGIADTTQHAAQLLAECNQRLTALHRPVDGDAVKQVQSPSQTQRRRSLGVLLAGVVVLSGFGLTAANRRLLVEPSATALEGARFTGTIKPSQRFTANAGAAGTVRRVAVKVGDRVAAGQVIVEIDDAVARTELDSAMAEHWHAVEEVTHWQRSIAALNQSRAATASAFAQSIGAVALAQRRAEQVPGRQLRDSPARAEAVLEQAASKLARITRLHAEGVVSDETLEEHAIAARIAQNDLENARQWHAATVELQRAQQEQARQQIARSRTESEQLHVDYLSRLSQAEVRVEQLRQRVVLARRALDEVVVKAAAGGVVVAISAVEGERLASGAPVMTIARLDELMVEVAVSSSLVNVLVEGQDALVTLPTVPEERVPARIHSINPLPAPNMTHAIDVVFANANGRLLSGQPAQVLFQ